MLRLSSRVNAITPPPRRVYLDVTRACPLRCRHCYAASQGSGELEMDLEELTGLARQVVELGTRSLVVAGGEPFVRDDLVAFLEVCSRDGLDTTVVTSGVVLDLPTVRALRRLGTEVRLSLDGATAETHEAIRGPNTFHRVKRALRLLDEAGVRRRAVHFTVNRGNARDLVLLPALLRDLRVRDLIVSTVKPAGRAATAPDLLLDPASVGIVRERIRALEGAPGVRLRSQTAKTWTGLGCPAGHVKLGITPEGRVTPCVFLGEEFVGGSLRHRGLRELWEEDAYLRLARSMPAAGVCGTCAALPLLNGGCRARAFHYHGRVDAPDPYCCRNARLCGVPRAAQG